MADNKNDYHEQVNPPKQKTHDSRYYKRGSFKKNFSRGGYHHGHGDVEDLREKLNRIRLDRNTEKTDKQPPPDPPNNFLKDPLRDNEGVTQKQRSEKVDYGQSNKDFERFRNRPNFKNQSRHNNDHHQSTFNKTKVDLQHPVNIKVQVTANTGERSCIVDNTVELPKIKHVPDNPKPHFQHQKYFYNNKNKYHFNDHKKQRKPTTKAKDSESSKEIESEKKSKTDAENKEDIQVEKKIADESVNDTENIKVEEKVEDLDSRVAEEDKSEKNTEKLNNLEDAKCSEQTNEAQKQTGDN